MTEGICSANSFFCADSASDSDRKESVPSGKCGPWASVEPMGSNMTGCTARRAAASGYVRSASRHGGAKRDSSEESIDTWTAIVERVAARGVEPKRYAAVLSVALGQRAITSRELFALATSAAEAHARSGDVGAALALYRRALPFEPTSQELLDRAVRATIRYGWSFETVGRADDLAYLQRARGQRLDHGWTQILRKDLVLVFLGTGTLATCESYLGCFANPYRYVGVRRGSDVLALSERHPASRGTLAGALRLSWALGRSEALHFGFEVKPPVAGSTA